VLNPLYAGANSPTYSEGNLKAGFISNSTTQSTISINSNKWYCEGYVGGTNDSMFGVGLAGANMGNYVGSNSFGLAYHQSGRYYYNGTNTSYGSAFTSGDVVGVAIDADINTIYFSVNGVWQNSADPVAGTGGLSIPSSISGGTMAFAF